MTYNGNTPLQPLIAKIIGCSPKNQVKIAEVTKQAKLDLGITSKARRLPAEEKARIYNHIVELYSQANESSSEQITSSKTKTNNVEINSQTQIKENINKTSPLDNFDNLRIAFYTSKDGKRIRQVISLDGYFINALGSIKVKRQDVPKWIKSQIDSWGAFDSKLPITRQVKYLIMREVVKGLCGSDDVFYN